MYFTENFKIGVTLLNKSNNLSNKGLLSIFGDLAEMHSTSIGYGVTDIEKTNCSWAILNWKVKIISRPKYGDTITVKTWSRPNTKLYCYRDFEVLNSHGDIIAIASSKWVLIDVKKGRISKVEDALINKYNPETKTVFESSELPKLDELGTYDSSLNYPIRKADIDINNHMNNLCYLDIAREILPENLSFSNECDNFEIMYKKQIKIDDSIVAYYGVDDNNINYVVVKSDDGNTVHSIMKFW